MEYTTDPKQMILRARKLSEEHLNQIKSQIPLTKCFLHEHLSEFVRFKFLLEPEDCTTDNFQELVQISLAKSMRISKDLVEEFDRAKTCDGATSAMAKRILLLLSIQKGLHITLPAEATADVVTLTDLSDLVWSTMAQTAEWRHIMQEEHSG